MTIRIIDSLANMVAIDWRPFAVVGIGAVAIALIKEPMVDVLAFLLLGTLAVARAFITSVSLKSIVDTQESALDVAKKVIDGFEHELKNAEFLVQDLRKERDDLKASLKQVKKGLGQDQG